MVSNPAAGIVLAGGKSQRMGTDKARLALPDGRPVILSVVEVLKSICGEVVVVTEVTGRYADLALPARRVTDIVPGCGPMGGLHAARHSHRHDGRHLRPRHARAPARRHGAHGGGAVRQLRVGPIEGWNRPLGERPISIESEPI